MLFLWAGSETAHGASSDVIIYAEGQTATQKSFNGYQLLELTTSLACTDEAHLADITLHNDDCYNYAYEFDTLNADNSAKYKAILLKVAGITVTTQTELALRDELLTKLEAMESEEEVRAFADSVYKEIKAANLTADVITDMGTAKIAQGYWLFADVTEDLEDKKDDAHSLVILDTKGTGKLRISEKKSVPTVTKAVAEEKEGSYSDYVDVNMQDEVFFRLTGTLPKDDFNSFDSYATYQYVFHDTLSVGLTGEESSVKVFVMDETGHRAEVVQGFTAVLDGQKLTVTMADVKSLLGVNNVPITVNKNCGIIVEYKAVLNSEAVIGSMGNPNTVYLEYSNDPYGEGTGTTIEDKVCVFTLQLEVTKVKAGDAAVRLPNAQFVICRLNEVGDKEYVQVDMEKTDKVNSWTTTKEDAKVFVTDAEGRFVLGGLDQGTYYLEEIQAPVGYYLLKAPIELVITAEYDMAMGVKVLKANMDATGEVASATPSDGVVAVTVENSAVPQLPSTGGRGTQILYLIGGILVLAAGGALIVKRYIKNAKDIDS